jgi:EmrB/QacA subfamily drug resistance transporter
MSSAVAQHSPVPEHHRVGEELSHRKILEVMTGLLAALFTAIISSTIVATALPTIMSDLHGTQRQYTWVITSSLLAMTVTTPIWGKLADLFDKKVLIQVAIITFVVGSVGAGLSQSVALLMVCRAVQGVAMGGLTAMVQAIIGSIIAPRQRGRYSGYMGATLGVATVAGPLLGGLITDTWGWRWCFYVCVPLAVIALILLQVTMKLPVRPRGQVRIDYLGAVLVIIAAALPMLWVTFAGSDYAWVSWQSAAFVIGFLLAAALAVIVELKVPQPMVPIRVLRNRITALMIVASIAVGTGMFAATVFLTQYFQLAAGHTPTVAGLMTIPLIVAQMGTAVTAGQIVTRTGRWKPVMLVGSVLLLVGLGGLGLTNHHTAYWQVAVFMALMGIGVGSLIQNIVLAVQNTVDVKDVGASSATISFFRSLGGAVGVSVLGAVLANQVQHKIASGITQLGGGAAAKMSGGGMGSDLDIGDLPAPVRSIVHNAYGDVFGHIFLIAGIVAIATLISVIAIKEVPLRTTVEMRPSQEQPSGHAPEHAAVHSEVSGDADGAHPDDPAAARHAPTAVALDDLSQRSGEGRTHQSASATGLLSRRAPSNPLTKAGESSVDSSPTNPTASEIATASGTSSR